MFGTIIHIMLHSSHLGTELIDGLIHAANEPVRLGALGVFEAWAVIVASVVTVLGGTFAAFMLIHRALNRIEHSGGETTTDLAQQAKDAKEAAERAQLEAASARASAARAEESIAEIRQDMKRLFALVSKEGHKG